MKESKDPFDRMILDDLEREADEIRRNVAAANLPPMTNEQKERIRENIQKEIDVREVQKICEQLPKDYQEALKIGMETIEKEKRKSGKDNETEATKVRADKETEEPKAGADKETEEPKAGADKETEEREPGFGANKETEEGELSAGTDEKKHRSRRKAYLSRVAAAVVIVLLAGGIGVTSFGGPERVMEIVKSKVGTREVEKVNSNEENLVIKEENEEQAYQKIKDELGIEPVRIVDRPNGFKYEEAKLEKDAQISEILYQYKGENILYTISMAQSNNSWGIDLEDKEVKKYTKKIKGVNMSIHEYITLESKKRRYVAKFKYSGVGYYLTGVMPKEDFNNILKKLYFS